MTSTTTSVPKRRRPMVWWAVGLLVVGLLVGVAGGVLFVGSAGGDVIKALTAPIRVTPTDFTLDLDEGTYVVYEQTSTSRSAGPLTTSRSQGVSITPADVTVLGPSGDSLPVDAPTMNETIDRGSSGFVGAARFTVADAGVHRIQVSGTGQQIILAPSIVSSFGSALGWLALVGLGVLLAVIGLILLIIGLLRKPRSAVVASGQATAAVPAADPWGATQALPAVPTPAAPAVATAATAGWYADPRGEARLRWWDGQQWTGHVS